MKKTVLFVLALVSAPFAYAGPAITAGPAIIMPSFEALTDFANRELPGFCEPIKSERINEVGPIGRNNLNGFVYSFSTSCEGEKTDYRIETSGGLAPQPYDLIRVR